MTKLDGSRDRRAASCRVVPKVKELRSYLLSAIVVLLMPSADGIRSNAVDIQSSIFQYQYPNIQHSTFLPWVVDSCE